VDVDERVRVEAALRESEQNLRLALAAGRMGVWRYDLATGTIAIDAAERALLGFAPDAAVVPVDEVFARIHEEDREAVRAAVARSIETGAEYQGEFRILGPGGEVRWLSGRGGVARDGAGRPAAMTGVNWNVTERRQAEAERARLAAIVEQASDLIGSADTLGRILYLNRAGRRLLGLGEEEDLVGLDADAFHPDRALGLIKGEALPTAARQGTWSGESALLTRDGHEIPISQLIIGHRNGAGQPAYFSTIARDISGQKRAERQRELLLRELSHRVKNILALVQAVARQTGARVKSVPAFVEAFGGRVMALAAAHELLTATGWAGAGLAELVKKALTPYLGRGEPRVRLEIEDDLSLKPEAAQNLALALHELATNAAKYGALSRPG
jgi:PAS domain S-box-containing protein